jgi:hypothetical protein
MRSFLSALVPSGKFPGLPGDQTTDIDDLLEDANLAWHMLPVGYREFCLRDSSRERDKVYGGHSKRLQECAKSVRLQGSSLSIPLIPVLHLTLMLFRKLNYDWCTLSRFLLLPSFDSLYLFFPLVMTS